MVFCIVAMVVFGFLGIFSAKYRTYAREAFRCFARLTTLRPCNTEFDEMMKAKITARLMDRSPRIARFTYAHFGAISVVFAVAMFASLAYTGYSVYNLAMTGACDPVHPEQCVFNPDQPNVVTCPFENLTPASGVPTVGGMMAIPDAPISGIGGKPLVYFFGTTWCPHCRWERPIFMNATGKFGSWHGADGDLSRAVFTSDYLVVRAYEIDKAQPPEADLRAFQHF
ncbi:MAG: thioredoxin family protein, partial [Candidatus Aenigmatarchaeota archaeon]